ncbi:25S rRNA (uracil2634-N3)-methyltransferase, partial [Tremellales sp. Uapishka_1]
MPSTRNLKGALISHKTIQARKAMEERNRLHKQAKQASIKTSSAERKAAKRKLQATSSSFDKGKRTQNHSERVVIPFDKFDSVLLIGEANFSFALSLLSPPHNLYPQQILATSYDSEDVCYDKYPDAVEIVKSLRRGGVKVEFGIDCTVLEKHKVIGKGGRWSRVIFNFPHAGAGITDQNRNILSNQTLLLKFLRSVAPHLTSGPSAFPMVDKSGKKKKVILMRGKANNKRKKVTSDDEDEDEDPVEEEDDNDDELLEDDAETTVQREMVSPNREGTVVITLLNQPPYTLWDLPHLATKPPAVTPGTILLQPRYRLLRSFEFHPDKYKGYAHRRTIGFQEGVSKADNEEIIGRKGIARTWEFARWIDDKREQDEGDRPIKRKRIGRGGKDLDFNENAMVEDMGWAGRIAK